MYMCQIAGVLSYSSTGSIKHDAFGKSSAALDGERTRQIGCEDWCKKRCLRRRKGLSATETEMQTGKQAGRQIKAQ